MMPDMNADANRLAARFVDLADRCLRAIFAVQIVNGDPHAALRQPNCDALPDRDPRSGHQRRFPLKISHE
jgi:hypothetical protein